MAVVPSVIRIGYDTDIDVRIMHGTGPVTVTATLMTQNYAVLREENAVISPGRN